MKTRIVLMSVIAIFLISSISAYAASQHTYGISLLLGVPHPLNLGLDYQKNENTSYGLGLGGIKAKFPSSAIEATLSNLEGRMRWHPFSGSFILGGILGYQNLTAKGKTSILVGPTSVPLTASLSIKSLYLTPHLGWFWAWGSGLTLGFELGLQIPVGPSSQFSTVIDDPLLNSLLDAVKQTADYKALENDIETQANRIGKIIFPYVTVLRLGWMF